MPGILAYATSFASPENERILAVILDGRYTLSDDLVAIKSNDAWFVPLGKICQALGFAINVDIQSKVAAGFFIKEAQTFRLDIVARRLQINGVERFFAEKKVYSETDDIYVSSELLEDWFPVELKFDSHAAELLVTAKEKLPIHIQLDRDQAFTQEGRQKKRAPLPRLEIPYETLDGLFWDHEVITDKSKSGSEEKTTAVNTSSLSGEIGGLEGLGRVRFNNKKRESDFLNLKKRDPEAKLLGPLKATDVSLFDFYFPSLPLAGTGRQGRGVLVSNASVNGQNEFGEHTFTGELSEGWEVELYRNGSIIDRKKSDTSGRYEIKDVPMLIGINDFVLKFYGPQGQIREERRSILVDQQDSKPGHIGYTLSGGSILNGDQQLTALEQIGLSDFLTMQLGQAELRSPSLTPTFQKLATAGLRAHIANIVLLGDVIQDEQAQRGSQVGAKMQLGRWNFSSKLARSYGILTPDFGTPEQPTEKRLTHDIDWNALPGLLNFAGSHTDEWSTENLHFTRTSARASLTTGMNILRYNYATDTASDSNRTIAGEVEDSLFLSPHELRVFAKHSSSDTSSEEKLLYKDVWDSFGSTGRFFLHDTYSLIGEVEYFLKDHSKSIAAGWFRQGKSYRTGLRFSRWHDDVAIGFDLSWSLGWDVKEGRGFSSPLPVAELAAIETTVFVDKNNNGKYDPEEEPLPGVGIEVNGRRVDGLTDSAGRLYTKSLQPMDPVDIEISMLTLADPNLVPKFPGVSVVPRRGKIGKVFLPIISVGEIAGTVKENKVGSTKALGGILVELIDASGQVIKSHITSQDGFFLIEQVPLGIYTLRLNGAQLNQLRFNSLPSTYAATLSPENTSIQERNFTLTKGSTEP